MSVNENGKIINMCFVHILLNNSQHSLINNKIEDFLIISGNLKVNFTFERYEKMFNYDYRINGKIIIEDGNILPFDASISANTNYNDLILSCYSDNSLEYAPYILDFLNSNKFDINIYSDYEFPKILKREIDYAYRLMMSHLSFKNNILYDYINSADYEYTLSDTSKGYQKRVLFLTSLLLDSINNSIAGSREITDNTRYKCISLLVKIIYDYLEYSIDSRILDSTVDNSIMEVKNGINIPSSNNVKKNPFLINKLTNNPNLNIQELKGILYVLSTTLNKLSYDKEDLLGNNLPDYTDSVNANIINTTEALYSYLIYPCLFKDLSKNLFVKNKIKSLLK